MKTYRLPTCTLNIETPALVGQAKGHFWFSTLHPLNEKEVLCEVVIADDKAQGQWPAVLYLSRDGGATWRKAADIASYGPISTPFGPRTLLFMPYELWPLEPGDKRNAKADGTIVTCDQSGHVAVRRATVRYLDFPRDLAPYHEDELLMLTNGNILPLRDRSKFATIYGTFAGEKQYVNVAVTSADEGLTWRFRSVVAGWQDTPGAGEGPCESNTCRLADGRLLCVYRVGSGRGSAYYQNTSADEGLTWSKPEPMPDVFSVEPQLVRLENGLILLSGGRPGLFLWVCADGEGKRWERVNLAAHHNETVADAALHYADGLAKGEDCPESGQTTSYTGMVAIGPNEVLISYDRLANAWHGAPGPWGETDAVFCVRVKAQAKSG